MRSLACALVCLASAPAFGQAGGGISWTSAKPEQDFAQAARASGEPTVVYFTAKWEPMCARLEEGPFSDPAIVRLSSGWNCLMVEIGDRKASTALRAKLHLVGLPTVRFFTREGAMVNEVVSTTEGEPYLKAFRGEGRIYKPHPMDLDVKKWHDTHRITLRNNSVVDGRLVEMSEDEVLFQYAPDSEVRFRRSEVRSIEWIRIRRIDEAPEVLGAPTDKPVDPGTGTRPADPPPEDKPVTASEAVRLRVDTLITQLTKGGPGAEDKNELIEALSKTGSDGLVYAASVLDKLPPGTSQWVLAAITRAKERKALPHLREKLEGSKDVELTVQLIGTLVIMQDPAAAKALMKQARHESANVRGAVIEGLGQLGDRNSLREIAAAVVDPDPSIRSRATAALLEIAQKHKLESSAYMALRTAAGGAPESRRDQVPLVCAQLGARESASMIMPWLRSREVDLRANSVIALGDLAATEAALQLQQMLEIEPENRIRVLVCGVLAKMRDLSCVPRLIETMGREKDLDVRMAATRALQQLTRQKFGPDHDQWRKWWEAQRGVTPENE